MSPTRIQRRRLRVHLRNHRSTTSDPDPASLCEEEPGWETGVSSSAVACGAEEKG